MSGTTTPPTTTPAATTFTGPALWTPQRPPSSLDKTLSKYLSDQFNGISNSTKALQTNTTGAVPAGTTGDLLGTSGTAGSASLVTVGTGLGLADGTLSNTGTPAGAVGDLIGASGTVGVSSLVTVVSPLALTSGALSAATETVDLLGPASPVQTTDLFMVARGTGATAAALTANITDVSTALVQPLISAMGMVMAPVFAVVVTSISVASGTATISGRYLDQFNAGVTYSIDGGTTWLSDQAAVITPDGAGKTSGSFTVHITNLSSGFWDLPIRLNSSPATIGYTGYFASGTLASTIVFASTTTPVAGSLITSFGYAGKSTGLIYGSFPALSSNQFYHYNSSTEIQGAIDGTPAPQSGLWFGNQKIAVPALAGTYQLFVKNSAESSTGGFVSNSVTLNVQAPIAPTLWMSPPSPTQTHMSAGPFTFTGQWGFTQPPGINYRVAGGTFDSGWVPAQCTISTNGTLAVVLPAITGLVSTTYYTVYFQRQDATSVTSYQYGIQG